MSVFTSISKVELAQFLASYPILPVESFEGIASGISNSNFYLYTKNADYVLAIVERQSFEEVEWVMQLIHFLAEKGFPCAMPVAQSNGVFAGVLAEKPATVVQKLSGADKRDVSPSDCKRFGQAVAQLHLLGMEFQLPHADSRGKAWRNETANKVRTKLTFSEHELLQSELLFNPQCKLADLPRSVIHGDLFRDNVLFNGNDISGFIDFYFACNGPMVYDLAIAFNDWCRHDDGRIHSERAESLLAGYCSVRSLQPTERKQWTNALRSAALRYWLSRLQDYYFPMQGEMASAKDPNSYMRILQQCVAEA